MAEYIKINYNSAWTGYRNFGDIANGRITDLQAGSQNTFVVDGRKLEPRAGMEYLGAIGTDGFSIDPYWTIAHRIHSSYDEFVNNQGLTIPIRVFYSGNIITGDIMEAWLPTDGDVTSNVKSWVQITSNNPTTPLISYHRYFFSPGWYDPQHLQNQLVFVYGAKGTGANYVTAWSGGFAPVVSITATTITTNTTWQEKGFIDPPEGPAMVVINGTEYPITSGDFSTNTITVASTAGINIGDLAFQGMQFDTLPGTFTGDVCSLINNQVYYIDWNNRSVLVSWNRNRDALLGETIYVGSSGLNDAVFNGTFTGSTTDTYVVTIDSKAPDDQTFAGNGTGTGFYITGGYSASGTHDYKFVFVADVTFAFTTAVDYDEGTYIIGATANDVAIVIWGFPGGAAVKHVSGTFVEGDTVTGTVAGTAGVAAVIDTGGAIWQPWWFFYKDGALAFQTPGVPTPLIGPTNIALGDGLFIEFDSLSGIEINDSYNLKIGDHDTFAWTLNGVSRGDHIPVDTSPTALSQGITVEFSALRGHNLGDRWTMIAYPKIIKGWREFYYTQPVRLAGEGFKILLDSNGWTMKPQESTMYLNALAGHFYTAKPQLSADLTSETIVVNRLKSEPQNKVLFPYLIGYIKNQLATISQDKTYDILGRQKFLELPQTKSISDWVRIDFETADWENGDILYFKRKIYFSVPRTGYIFVWDDFMKYWHPPQKFAKGIGNLAIIDNKLCGHSYERNETYELFVGMNDLTDYPIDTRMVFAYDGNSARLAEKAASAIGFEGYVSGAPQIQWQVNFGVGGCDGTPNGIIRPVLCLPKDTASLGKSSLGFHGLGNSPVTPATYFNYIKPFGSTPYYLRNMELSCVSLDQRWSIISIGTDVSKENINNASICDRT